VDSPLSAWDTWKAASQRASVLSHHSRSCVTIARCNISGSRVSVSCSEAASATVRPAMPDPRQLMRDLQVFRDPQPGRSLREGRQTWTGGASIPCCRLPGARTRPALRNVHDVRSTFMMAGKGQLLGRFQTVYFRRPNWRSCRSHRDLLSDKAVDFGLSREGALDAERC